MFAQRFRFALLAGVVAAVSSTARAGDCCSAPAPCCTKTVCCTEWVSEQYQSTRTVYKTEYKQEAYTAYKCESYPEVCTRQVTCYKMVPEMKTTVCSYNVCVPVVEEKTVMQPFYTCKQVTKMVCKTEDHGHYECREVPCEPSCWDKLRSRFRHHDCCDCCEPCCVKTKTVKCWVPCIVTVQCPVTTTVKVCEYKPVVVKCCSYKTEVRTKEVQTCCYKCVPETREEKYTVMKTRQVAVPATRCVAVCVPVTETVTCCRMVPKTVVKEIPCCETCKPCCK